MLPPEAVVIGLDEHTALVMDLGHRVCRVMGRGRVTLVRGGEEQRYTAGRTFPVTELGSFRLPQPETGIPTEVWERVLMARAQAEAEGVRKPPPEVLALVEAREAARARGDWAASDELREQIAALGWEVRDTRTGPELTPLSSTGLPIGGTSADSLSHNASM